MSQKAFDRVLQQSADLGQQLGLCTTQLATVRTQMLAMAGGDGEHLSSTKAAAAQSGGWVEGPRVRTDRSSAGETTAAAGDATGASETTQARTLPGAPPPLGGRVTVQLVGTAEALQVQTSADPPRRPGRAGHLRSSAASGSSGGCMLQTLALRVSYMLPRTSSALQLTVPPVCWRHWALKTGITKPHPSL